MNDSESLVRQLDLAIHGEAWHGPSWKEILEGLTATDAGARPIEGAHTIFEILRHATTWNDVVRRRLEGEVPDVSDAEDWPGPVGADTWADAVARFFDRGVALRDTVARFPAERLHEPRATPATGSWSDLILGQLQHLTCHAGQVALLKKGLPARG